jgi:co-chaperonin GroES (HSP10)
MVRTVGTVKSIADRSVTLATDSGSEMKILIPDGTKIVRVAPGQTDIKQATPIALSDLQVGDRIFVRGKTDQDGKSVDAASLIAMARTDVAAKQAKDRDAWQKHGFGGIVGAVDPASSTITISVTSNGEKKNVAVHVGKDTVLRRYAPDSIKFDDAKLSSLDKVHVGDQLRARGTRSSDGSELTADEVVSGTFRNIAGTISALDATAGTIVVQDLTTKKPVTVKVTADSQLRKLPPQVAQRIAARLTGESPSAASNAGPSAGGGAAPATQVGNAPQGAPAAGNSAGPGAVSGSGAGRSGGAGGQGGGDLQQIIGRMPAANLSDLQKGDAVMVVTTEGADGGAVTAITLLAGVEPILQGAPKGQASILSPWSLGGAPSGDTGTP